MLQRVLDQFKVVLVNAIIGVAQESKAEKSLEALQKLSDHASKVIRDGKLRVIPAKELVPGDLVVLDTGDYIPADLRIIEEVNLKSQESSLTGESVPTEKSSEIIKETEIGIGDRKNMLFSSSLVTYGRGKGIVVETGMTTEVGKIASMINSTEKQDTPLQQKLNKLGKTLGIAALIICIVIFVLGLIQGKEPIQMFMTAVSLAVAAIPEGLAAVSTIVLAIGVQKMVKKNAIVKRLPAVETLGSSTVICSDKTGTLTQNKMTVEKIYWNEAIRDMDNIQDDEIDEELKKLVYANMLCNDTKISQEGTLTGDPTETALVQFGLDHSFDIREVLKKEPRVAELPFDSERKLMSTIHKEADGKYLVAVKGAPDQLLKRVTRIEENGQVRDITADEKQAILQVNKDLAKQALRVLMMAYKYVSEVPTLESEIVESDLIFSGLVGMIDPERPEAAKAVAVAKEAGIRPIMITGDHQDTAEAIAKRLGIIEDDGQDHVFTGAELNELSDEEFQKVFKQYSVYARVSPEHKVRIVKAWQNEGKVVAMTGDGVNDAPSLKTADIGIGMGITGTEVSKGASDMVLADDNFATIIVAVEEGRKVFSNIQKSIQYLLSANMAEVLTIFFATLFGWDVLQPVHLLWINLVTDTLPAIALGVEPAEPDVMTHKPRGRKSNFFDGGVMGAIIYQGIFQTLLVLGVYGWALMFPEHASNRMMHEDALTMAFATLGLIQLLHAFNVKSVYQSIFTVGAFRNRTFNRAIPVAFLLLMVTIVVPGFNQLFHVSHLSVTQWLAVIIGSLLMVVLTEIVKAIQRALGQDEKAI